MLTGVVSKRVVHSFAETLCFPRKPVNVIITYKPDDMFSVIQILTVIEICIKLLKLNGIELCTFLIQIIFS